MSGEDIRSQESLPNVLRSAIEEALEADQKRRGTNREESQTHAANAIRQLMEQANRRVRQEGADSDASLQDFRLGLIRIDVTTPTATKFADVFFKELRKGRLPLRRWFNEFLAVIRNDG